jgi:ketosteroid isomerase-like protein
MIRTMLAISGAVLLCVAVPAVAQPGPSAADYQRCEGLQGRFNEARARQDAQGMAAVFAENAVRVTPDGIFQGRDAIRGNLQSLVTAGLRDFTSQRTVLRHEGDLLLDAGEWHATFGDMPLHGYYSAVLSCRGDQPEILEETTNVAAPPRR